MPGERGHMFGLYCASFSQRPILHVRSHYTGFTVHCEIDKSLLLKTRIPIHKHFLFQTGQRCRRRRRRRRRKGR